MTDEIRSGGPGPVPQVADESQEMIVTVTIQTDSGSYSYTGHIVSRGPSTMEMLLTEPFPMAGRCVQFPTSEILTEQSHATRSSAVRVAP